jgi:DNA-binding NarL/FixJ family response regulator
MLPSLSPHRPAHLQGPYSPLSPREVEILRLITEGERDRTIADALVISPRTVTSHVTSILNKLGVENRTAAAVLAVRRGLT